MGERRLLLVRARVVLPVSQPPIENGALLLDGDQVVEAAPWDRFASLLSECETVDVGDAILMPGLVNAHCHLDYTAMAGEVSRTRLFTDWLKCMVTFKGLWSYTEFAQSWLSGAGMLLRHGVTTVADIESSPELLPEVWDGTPLRVHSFLEMTGIKLRRQPLAIVEEAIEKFESLPIGRNRAGLSPHAPYSTAPSLLRLAAQAARQRHLLLTIHASESDVELEMFLRGRGPMFDWLQRNERNMSDCGLGSPIQHLARNEMLGRDVLAAHVNYLEPGDADLLGRAGTSVAHCPRSHAFFGHRRFPREELLQAGVNLCLGTDSLASVIPVKGQPLELNLFSEMQLFAQAHPSASPEQIVAMATTNSARALGREGELGAFSKGARADCIVMPFSGGICNAYETVVHHNGPVAGVMIDGRWVIMPPLV